MVIQEVSIELRKRTGLFTSCLRRIESTLFAVVAHPLWIPAGRSRQTAYATNRSTCVDNLYPKSEASTMATATDTRTWPDLAVGLYDKRSTKNRQPPAPDRAFQITATTFTG